MATHRKRRVARGWHRWVGIIASAPLLWLAVSGLLLNHTEFFGLNGKEVTATWVLKRYHQLPEGEARGVDWGGEEGGVEVVEWDEILFYDGRMLEVSGKLIGAVPFGGGAALATEDAVYLLSEDGTLVDRLDESVLPGTPLEGVVLAGEGARLAVQVGGKRYLYDEDLLEATEMEVAGDLVPVTVLNASDRAQLESAVASASGIPRARVILDLHTGKFFGWPGWLITDLSAVSLVLLILLGLRLFPKRKM